VKGTKVNTNPFFTKMGFGPSKGEVLHVKIPNADFTKMYKDKIFIVHLYDDVYWVGSGYEWYAPDDLPSDAARTKLTAELDRLLLIPYEILDHKAAIRPTMHNRRPLLAVHVTIPGMYMFNGLGTKGSSIGPFVAKQFAEYLVTKDVRIVRALGTQNSSSNSSFLSLSLSKVLRSSAGRMYLYFSQSIISANPAGGVGKLAL
jgi:glycine/D-amino acid oxidase-like deaminating enzyme